MPMTETRGGREVFGALRQELLTHLPYTVSAVALCSAFLAAWNAAFPAGGQLGWPQADFAGVRSFEFFHLTHLYLSALTTTSVFLSHERNVLKALIVSLVTAPALCTVSDILVPYGGVRLLGQSVDFHLCLAEEPVWAWGMLAAGMGSAFGLTRTFSHCSRLSHFGHIFISTMATVLYILSESHIEIRSYVLPILAIVVVAVVVPCLVSDVVVPMSLARHSACKSNAVA